MVIKVQDIITAALQDIGAAARDETPSVADMTDGLKKLNFMIDAWSVRSLMVIGTILESFTLTSGQYIYTIGIGGNLNTPKPSEITDAYVRDTNNEDTPINIISADDYSAITDKAISTGRPEGLFFDEGQTQALVPTGIICLYPSPDQAYTLFLRSQKALIEFANLTDTVSFQPAYYEALEYNLAVRLWPQYHSFKAPVDRTITELARESMKVIETMNARQVTATIEVPGKKGGAYNIYTQGYTT